MPALATPPDESSGGRRSLPDFSDLAVLIVDDYADSRELLRTIFEQCGAAVLEAEAIAHAREYVETVRVDLIITDLALPAEDGALFLRWLRARSADKGGTIPAIAVTAFPEDFPAATVSGWAAYFQKPIEADDYYTP